MSINRRALLVCFSTLLLASAMGLEGQTTNGTGAKVVGYGPKKTTLVGQLVIQTKFGPPNYGESPGSDKKIRIYVLRLAVPITAKDMDDSVGEKGLEEIELFLLKTHGPNSWDSAHREIGKCISAVGEIRPSQLGFEFTPLVMNVDKLIVLKPNECHQVTAKPD